MKSAYQSILLAVFALSASAQLTQPIEAQFRIVRHYVVYKNRIPELIQRCMSLTPGYTKPALPANNPDVDKALCRSNDSLFTIAQMSQKGSNLFIGDYTGGTAKQLHLVTDLLSRSRPLIFITDTGPASTDSRLQVTARNELQLVDKPGFYVEIEYGSLVVGKGARKERLPTIMPVLSNSLRQFRLKRFDSRTNVTRCATVLANGYVGFQSAVGKSVFQTISQASANRQCAQNSSIFTFNTVMRQLSNIAGPLTTGIDGWLRIATTKADGSNPTDFFLMPSSPGGKAGLMAARPAGTFTMSPSGYVRADGDPEAEITSEFWPEFII